ncbi:Arylsulfatase [Planctomycetes bacterium Pan216]|uniref:Arylsulfatase n=1 Tax=Kolteria novifilia TaxID=2527975 RepID=A0A518B5T2_9BACT|nr:Arylsulfatase [Planctomycetes bacterium Pan216]
MRTVLHSPRTHRCYGLSGIHHSDRSPLPKGLSDCSPLSKGLSDCSPLSKGEKEGGSSKPRKSNSSAPSRGDDGDKSALFRSPRTTRYLLAAFLTLLVFSSADQLRADDPPTRTSFLLITVDDMNWDSLGVHGCAVPDITPNIDRLAREGLRFDQGYVNIAVCQPCRAVWMTGRYPHRNGAEGFEPIDRGVPTLLESLHDAGYLTGILAKVPHVLPSRSEAWDVVVDAGSLRVGRDPKLYREASERFFEKAKREGKPFFLMANSQDPHRPFAGSAQERAKASGGKKNKNRKNKRPRSLFPEVADAYEPDEVTVPGFLPDLPEVRQEIAEYYTSVHRADQIVGAVLEALDDAGLRERTLVMFLSDHGMPLPFAKTNCYQHSLRTPWIVRWPGKTKAGAVDRGHVISGIDLTPTVLDALGMPPLEGVDGRSFAPLLEGTDDGKSRKDMFAQFHRTAGKRDYPMRAVQGARFGYIFNPWSDGKLVFKNESQSGRTMKAMHSAASDDPKIAERVDLFLHRVPEEFYDYQNDPDARKNLIEDPAYAKQLAAYRERMREYLAETDDPVLADFRQYRSAEESGKKSSLP